MYQHVETMLVFLTQKGVRSTPRPALAFITLHFVSLSAHKTWIIVCMYHKLPFHFQTAGHTGCFQSFIATALLCQVTWHLGSFVLL